MSLFFDEVRLAIPLRFLLNPPDGGNAKTVEGIRRMAAHIEALEAALREIIAAADDEGVPVYHRLKAARNLADAALGAQQ